MTSIRMRLTSLLAVLATLAPNAVGARAAPQDPAAVVKALEQWLAAYQRNRIELGSRADLGDRSIGRRNEALPKGLLGRLTPRRELEELLAAAAAHESAETLRAVLAVAAVGLDDHRYDFRAMPHVARELALRALAGFDEEASVAELRRIASEGIRAAKGAGEGMQAAALRALAARPGAAEDLGRMTAALGHADADVRAAAADALAQAGTASELPALAAAIQREQDGGAMDALAGAARRRLEGASSEQVETLAAAVAGALGRTTWRADQSLVAVLTAARRSAAIPALIGVLERFVGDAKALRSGALSGVLRQRAHEALIDLTGTFFEADRPELWREWWAEHESGFTVAPRKREAPPGEERTTAGFFGIPVHGTRVLFVIDLSLSMQERMRPLGTSTADPSTWPTRLDVAREQVWEAAQKLDENAVFDLVVFSKEARRWQGKLVAANDASRKKLRRFLDELEPEPYTNLWSGIRSAMEFEAGTDAADNQLALDELFVLSDGAPTIGEVTDPVEIARLVTEANRAKRIRIHTVFLKGGADVATPVPGEIGPGELMRRIAEQNDGRFVEL